MEMTCENCGDELDEQEHQFYAAQPNQRGPLGEVLCDECAGGSSARQDQDAKVEEK